MAKRYFNVLRNHVFILVILITLVCLSEFTKGTVSTVSTIGAGILLIYAAISYAMWLFKTPGRVSEDES